MKDFKAKTCIQWNIEEKGGDMTQAYKMLQEIDRIDSSKFFT